MGTWQRDPLERAAWRWHDGEQWSDEVADGDVPPDAPPGAVDEPAAHTDGTPPDWLPSSDRPPTGPGTSPGQSPGVEQAPASGPESEPSAGSTPSPGGGQPVTGLTGNSTFAARDLSKPTPRRDWRSEAMVVARGAAHGANDFRREQPFGFAAAVLVLIVVAGFVIANLGGGSQTLRGEFELTADGYDTSGLGCAGSGGYGDIAYGTNVTVRDESGTLIGTTSLGIGEEIAGSCVFDFEVELPKASFYEIEVGRRGSLTYTADELDRQGWYVGFTLGD